LFFAYETDCKFIVGAECEIISMPNLLLKLGYLGDVAVPKKFCINLCIPTTYFVYFGDWKRV